MMRILDGNKIVLIGCFNLKKKIFELNLKEQGNPSFIELKFYLCN